MSRKKEYKLSEENQKLISEYEADLDLAVRSKDSYTYALKRIASEHLVERSLLDLKLQDVTSWFRGKKWGLSYKCVIVAAIKSFASWASDNELVDAEKVLPLMKQKPKRYRCPSTGYIRTSQIWGVIDAAGTPRARLVCTLLFGTGCRRSALAALKWGDFDLEQHRLILRAGITKGNKRRTVGLMDWVEEELLLYKESLDDQPQPQDYLFPSALRKEGYVAHETIYWDFRKATGRAGGIPEELRHPHAARHTFAIALLESGEVDLLKLQRTLGHADLSTTAIYLDVADIDRERAVRGAIKRPKKESEPPTAKLSEADAHQLRLVERVSCITDYF